MNSFNQIFTILSDIYQTCQIIQTGCLLRMRDVTGMKSIVIITKQKAAMTKIEFEVIITNLMLTIPKFESDCDCFI